jgi:type IV pilus assembly protein PilX
MNHCNSHKINLQRLPKFSRNQDGAVLIIGLLILLVLTILGITNMSTTSMQERMAGNDRDRQIAFQSAEAALRAAEEFVQNSTYAALAAGNFTAACTNGLCAKITTGNTDNWLDNTVWSTSTKHRVYTANFNEIVSNPKFIVEDLGKVLVAGVSSLPDCYVSPFPCPNMYRITALGTGSSDNSRVMLQSVFRKEPE